MFISFCHCDDDYKCIQRNLRIRTQWGQCILSVVWKLSSFRGSKCFRAIEKTIIPTRRQVRLSSLDPAGRKLWSHEGICRITDRILNDYLGDLEIYIICSWGYTRAWGVTFYVKHMHPLRKCTPIVNCLCIMYMYIHTLYIPLISSLLSKPSRIQYHICNSFNMYSG